MSTVSVPFNNEDETYSIKLKNAELVAVGGIFNHAQKAITSFHRPVTEAERETWRTTKKDISEFVTKAKVKASKQLFSAQLKLAASARKHVRSTNSNNEHDVLPLKHSFLRKGKNMD